MKRTAAITAAIFGFGTIVAAQEVAPNDVMQDEYGAVEVSVSGVAGDPAAGMDVFSNRSMGNCVACHQITGLDAAFPGNIGPSLDGAADRWEMGQLRGIVVNAKGMFPDTIMPSFYKVSGFIRPGDAFTGKAAPADLPPLLTAQQIEDVVAYLATLKD